jgi:hypothetical protein
MDEWFFQKCGGDLGYLARRSGYLDVIRINKS